VAWSEVEREPLIVQHPSEACVKNWKAADRFDSCEVLIPKLKKKKCWEVSIK
jgi:hypothetical protein